LKTENEISAILLDKAIKVHKVLGPGLYEKVYEECLCYELKKSGIYFERQKAIPVVYEEVVMELGYRCDLMVEGKVIIELKSVSDLDDLHLAQMLTYLKMTQCKLGLLINFNVELLKNGFKRIANNI
jgi:GxxExxY protein